MFVIGLGLCAVGFLGFEFLIWDLTWCDLVVGFWGLLTFGVTVLGVVGLYLVGLSCGLGVAG